jgi:hypothetical protein
VVVALVHAYVIGHVYFVGSFDDDANYILTARALLHGQGLTGRLVSGSPVVSAYPPGFALLLVPIEWLRAASFVPFQVFSALCYAAVLPLTWVWMRRLRMPDSACVGTQALLAVNIVGGTFSVMVMAEAPYLLCLMLLLLAAGRWERSGRTLTPTGVVVAVLGAELVWLKEAGLGFTVGVAVWYLLRRRAGRAVMVGGVLAASLLPVVVARLVDGIPLAGGRYTHQLDRYYSGGLLERLVHAVPANAWTWLTFALPRTLTPFLLPLIHGTASSVLICQVTVFSIVGAVVAWRRHRDLAIVASVVYAVETIGYIDVNERRVVLILPVVLAWYCLGVREVVELSLRGVSRWRSASERQRRLARGCAAGTWALLGVVLLIAPQLRQFPRDYLFPLGVATSRPQGSRYMAILHALRPYDTVVETDYLNTTALFTGHRTAKTAFENTYYGPGCPDAAALAGIRADHAGFLLLGALNKYQTIDDPCLLRLASTEPWAVRLLRTRRDEASVFELIGPATAHPDLVDYLTGRSPRTRGPLSEATVGRLGATDVPGTGLLTPIVDGSASFTWSWGAPLQLSQVSVGEAGVIGGAAHGTTLQIELPSGAWRTVAASATGVGDGRDNAPYLLDQLPPSTYAVAMRLTVDGSGQAFVLDPVALGNPAASPS